MVRFAVGTPDHISPCRAHVIVACRVIAFGTNAHADLATIAALFAVHFAAAISRDVFGARRTLRNFA